MCRIADISAPARTPPRVFLAYDLPLLIWLLWSLSWAALTLALASDFPPVDWRGWTYRTGLGVVYIVTALEPLWRRDRDTTPSRRFRREALFTKVKVVTTVMLLVVAGVSLALHKLL